MLSDRRADQLDSVVVLTALLSNHAQQVQRVGMLRFLLQDFPITRFRLSQTIRLVVCQPEPE